MEKLTMISNAQLKLYSSLKQKKYRSRHGLFLAEGERTVEQLLGKKNLQAEAVVVSPDSASLENLVSLCDAAGARLLGANKKELLMLSDTQHTQGVLAVVQVPQFPAPGSWEVKPGEVLLALDGLSDPGNAGTLYRTAAWFGSAGLLVSEGSVDLYNPKVVRSTAGATGSLPAAECSLPEVVEEFHKKGCTVLLLDLNEQAQSLDEVAKAHKENPKPLLLVVGNEAHGISEELKGRYASVYIPGKAEQVESLNAAISAGIALSWLS